MRTRVQIRIRFDRAICRVCPTRSACTTSPAGVESTPSRAVRRFDLRQSRYIGLARTHLQQVLTATAMNIVRVIDWLRGRPQGEKKRPAGRFARLAPGPLAIGALASARVT